MKRPGPHMERLRRGARHRPDQAFRHNSPGLFPVCEVWIEPSLDVHMINVHLEMAQLWRCPVEWCAVWEGSVRASLKHLSEKHGGSSLFALKNVAKFPPPPPLDCFPPRLADGSSARCFGCYRRRAPLP